MLISALVIIYSVIVLLVVYFANKSQNEVIPENESPEEKYERLYKKYYSNNVKQRVNNYSSATNDWLRHQQSEQAYLDAMIKYDIYWKSK
jgi:hypothetical protein